MDFDLIYPDVLGAITDYRRFSVGDIQYGVGVFPAQAFLNQPIEIVVVLQNMSNGDSPTRISLALPTKDRKGNPAHFVSPTLKETVRLRSAEVAVVHIPLMAKAPTQAGRGYRVRVRIENNANAAAKRVRPPDGGPPPSVLAVSPFRINALKDVHFVDEVVNNVATISVDIASKALPADQQMALRSSYETLWALNLLKAERQAASEKVELARQVAAGLNQGTPYNAYFEAVQERFGQVGQPLHPGEARAIARMMTYTTEEATTLEHNYDWQNTRWFKQLCQLLAHDEGLQDLPRNDLFANDLFDAIIYDTAHLAFNVVQGVIKDNLGNLRERATYIDKLLRWLNGSGEPDLNFVYMPLAMGGLVVNPLVRVTPYENPWLVVDQISEAVAGRKTLQGDAVIVFELMAQILKYAQDDLTTRRIGRLATP